MPKAFKPVVIKYLRQRFSEEFPTYLERKIKKRELALNSDKPFLLFSKCANSMEYFIYFLIHRDYSKVHVEIGWKASDPLPVNVLEFAFLSISIRNKTFDWPKTNIAFTLLGICEEQRCHFMYPWNFFATEVWNEETESYEEFYSRKSPLTMQNMINHYGNITEEFATQQVELVGSDIIRCIKNYGIPFLEEAIRRHQT